MRLCWKGLVLWLVLAFVAEARADNDPGSKDLIKTIEHGPLKVTVSLAPKEAKLGDRLTLTLTVDAQRHVAVEMPPFGEALGRFSIVNFTPRTETLPGGETRSIQRYVLDPPMSGSQRIPPLRVRFVDNRPGAASAPGATADAGADGGVDGEVLTEELTIQIASVLPPQEGTAELRPLRGALSETAPSRARLYGILATVPGVLIAAYLVLRALRLRAAVKRKVSAFDVAMGRLSRLLDKGPPAPEEADAFYVELSDVVRRYIEDRFSVRAPELTTEEFLREARQLLSQAHRELLEAFLSTCDRVKFAGHRPKEEESRRALDDAKRFLEDTRVREAAP